MTGKPIEVTPGVLDPRRRPAVHRARSLSTTCRPPPTSSSPSAILEAEPFFHVNGKLQDDGSIGSPKWASLMVKEKNREVLLADSAGAAKKLFIGGGAGASIGAILAVVGVLTATPKPAEAEPTVTTSATSTAPVAAPADSADEADDTAKPKAHAAAKPGAHAAEKNAAGTAKPAASAAKPAASAAPAAAKPAASGAAKPH